MKNYNSGVYKITNTQNGHFYLGSTEALEKGLETKRKKNLPSSLRGRKASEETKQKMSASLKGHIGCSHTEETKQRLREAAIRQWEKKKLQDKGGV